MIEPKDVWEQLSDWWDSQIGEGDPFHTHLIYPVIDRCLPLGTGHKLLDLACGNGSVSRRFASRGVQVTAVDFSSRLLDIARRKSEGDCDIEYLVCDLTSSADLELIPSRNFDAALCSMAIHTLETVNPLLVAVARLLRPGGRFVFSIVHPCFNSTPRMSIITEEDFSGESVTTSYSMRVFDYLSPVKFLGRAKQDQPVPHQYYHRPLAQLLESCFATGFVVDGFFEPSSMMLPSDVPSMWKRLPAIPPVLLVSMRLENGTGVRWSPT